MTPMSVLVRGRECQAPCRNCWQCKENRIQDWVGRCIAEDQDAVATSVVTLTYGQSDRIGQVSSDLGSSILIYSDVQKFVRAIRDAGFPVRYFLAGEYGSKNGRAHWHVLLFWQRKVPEFEVRKACYMHDFWPHGFSYWDDQFHEKSAYYVCKYMLKDALDGKAQSEFHMSKYPPLGDAYFKRRAVAFAEQGILPKNAFYKFPHVRVKKTGLPREYMMQGVTLDNFCAEFLRAWGAIYGTHPLDVQHSEFLQNWCDAVAPRSAAEGFEVRKVRFAPFCAPPEGYEGFELCEPLNAYVARPLCAGLPQLFWSFDGEGKRAWQSVLRTEAEAEALERQKDGSAYLARSKGW